MVKSGWKNAEEAFQHVRLFSDSMLNSSEVFLNVCRNEDSFSWPSDELMICWSISEVQFAKWNCGYQVQTSSSTIITFSSVVAVTGQPLSLRRSVKPVSLICLIKLWTAMRKYSKLRCSFQIMYVFQSISLISFSMAAFCLSVKTILLRSSELENCGTSERRPVTSTDFDLHCNGFLNCHDFFTWQRRNKTN